MGSRAPLVQLGGGGRGLLVGKGGEEDHDGQYNTEAVGAHSWTLLLWLSRQLEKRYLRVKIAMSS